MGRRVKILLVIILFLFGAFTKNSVAQSSEKVVATVTYECNGVMWTITAERFASGDIPPCNGHIFAAVRWSEPKWVAAGGTWIYRGVDKGQGAAECGDVRVNGRRYTLVECGGSNGPVFQAEYCDCSLYKHVAQDLKVIQNGSAHNFKLEATQVEGGSFKVVYTGVAPQKPTLKKAVYEGDEMVNVDEVDGAWGDRFVFEYIDDIAGNMVYCRPYITEERRGKVYVLGQTKRAYNATIKVVGYTVNDAEYTEDGTEDTLPLMVKVVQNAKPVEMRVTDTAAVGRVVYAEVGGGGELVVAPVVKISLAPNGGVFGGGVVTARYASSVGEWEVSVDSWFGTRMSAAELTALTERVQEDFAPFVYSTQTDFADVVSSVRDK